MRATEEVVSHQPGYVSANIHESLDGMRVTNNAQWRSRKDFEVMFRNPRAVAHMREAEETSIAYEPRLCEVSCTHEVI